MVFHLAALRAAGRSTGAGAAPSLSPVFLRAVLEAVHTHQTQASTQAQWTAKLNDQDLLNVFYTHRPELLYVLPCEWNVQYHARLNTLLHCGSPVVKGLLSLESASLPSRGVTVDRVPLNCAASRERRLYACPRRAKVLHYMAQVQDPVC